MPSISKFPFRSKKKSFTIFPFHAGVPSKLFLSRKYVEAVIACQILEKFGESRNSFKLISYEIKFLARWRFIGLGQ